MSQPSFDEQLHTGTPWAKHHSVILSTLEQAHHAGAKGSGQLTGPLSPAISLMESPVIFNSRHPFQSPATWPSGLRSNPPTRPTFSQIFFMSHISHPNPDEEEDTSRYPIITTHHRLPKAKVTFGLERQPSPQPVVLPQQRRKFSVEIPVIRKDLMESITCSPIIYAERDQDESTTPLAQNSRSIVVKKQKSCILGLARAWFMLGAPLYSIKSRLLYIAKVFDISLVITFSSGTITCIFQDSNDAKRPEVHYVQHDRRLSLRALRQVDLISERLVHGAMHSVGNAMQVNVENAINQLDIVIQKEGKPTPTGITKTFERFAIAAHSLRMLHSKRRKEPFPATP